MNNNHCFILEQLPNEIFYELFEYFNIYELYRLFSKLNSRIDLLIKEFQYLQLTLLSIDDFDHPINRYFLPNIKTLIINHSKQFFDPIKFVLPAIRCLILCQPTRQQWNSIEPIFFPHLERLYLFNSVFAYRTEQICQLIFSNKFPYLRSCSLPFVAYEENNQWINSPIIQSLQVKLWDIRVYKQILDVCPNLIRFKIELTGGNNQENILLLEANRKHSILQYLSLDFSTKITSEFIDSVLFFVPNLQQFSLNATSQRPSYISMNTLASILQNRTSKLNRIKINIPLPESLCCKEELNTKYLLFKSYKIQSELIRPSRLIIIGSL